jgi:hypothetical protein
MMFFIYLLFFYNSKQPTFTTPYNLQLYNQTPIFWRQEENSTPDSQN